MKTIKKILVGVLVVVGIIAFTSCIDIFQNITLDSDNNITMAVRYTVSKAIFELGDSDGPIEDVFADQVISEDLAKEMFGENGKKKVSFETVNTESDYGAMIKVSYPKNMKITDEDVGFPKISPNRIEIKPFIGDGEQVEDDPYSMMFFSSMKYRLQLSKNVLPHVTSARLQFLNESSHTLYPIDLEDSYLFEIPLVLLMSGEDPTLIFEK